MTDETLIVPGFGDAPPGEGAMVAGFTLGGVLGRGAQGVVYRATRPGDVHPYAAKVVSTKGLSEAVLGRLRRESTLTSRMRHPGIVAVHQVVETPAYLVIIMDQALGRPAQGLCDGNLGWELSLRIVTAAARALDYVYRRNGVIHRDIKPANLIVDLAGAELKGMKVVDFGLGRSRNDVGDAGLTMAGEIMGTPLYMSPEQAQGERKLTFATDLYSLGATLFHLVAGRAVFNRGTPVEILVHHCRTPAPSLAEVAKGCPPALAELVRRCLAKSPAERFRSYSAFLDLAGAILAGNPFDLPEGDGDAARPRGTTTAVRPAVAPVAAPPTTRSAWRRPDAVLPPPTPPTAGTPGTTRSAWRRPTSGVFSVDPAAPPAEGVRSAWRRPGEAAPAEPAAEPDPGRKRPTTRWQFPALAAAPSADPPQIAAAPAATPDDPATESTDRPPEEPELTMGPSADTRPPMPSLAAGTTIGEYFAVVRPIGAGAMGEVYEVEDRFIERRLAMKIMSVEDMRRPAAVARFKSEASALATVGHEAFPYLAGGGSFQGRDYLFMELVQGIDLRTWLKRRGGTVPERTALAITLQLAQAMEAAYRVCGMVHRDLKPANLMVAEHHDGSPQVRIIDFGVSVYIDYGDWDDYSDRAYSYIDDGNEGRVVGTPAFMSPEQVLAGPPSPLMDMYAIGGILYQMISGHTPYSAPTSAAMMMKVLNDEPPGMEDIAGIGNGTRYVAKRLLAKKPAARFKNYHQLIAALEAALRGRTVEG
ncbi:MAG: serine/threonine protein kinase [Planctomycetes bacterium]|nr:serine/threonine protein kinase [Planctomycetota bacterium]